MLSQTSRGSREGEGEGEGEQGEGKQGGGGGEAGGRGRGSRGKGEGEGGAGDSFVCAGREIVRLVLLSIMFSSLQANKKTHEDTTVP